MSDPTLNLNLTEEKNVRVIVTGKAVGPASAHGLCAIYINDEEEPAARITWEKLPPYAGEGERPYDDTETEQFVQATVDLAFPAGDHVITARLSDDWEWDETLIPPAISVKEND